MSEREEKNETKETMNRLTSKLTLIVVDIYLNN